MKCQYVTQDVQTEIIATIGHQSLWDPVAGNSVFSGPSAVRGIQYTLRASFTPAACVCKELVLSSPLSHC